MFSAHRIVIRTGGALAMVTALAAGPAAATTVKVMTYNTHHGGLSTTPTTTDGQLDTIAAQNPDVVVLQEACESQLSYYVNGLNSRLGTTAWHGADAKHCKSGTAPTCTSEPGESVMILTRLTTLATNSTLIWASDDYWVARATVRMQVALSDGTPVNIFVCHLPALSDAAASRVTYISSFQAWAGTFSGPRLVGGDFNDHPGTTPIVNMTQTYTDAWTVDGSGYGYTHPADIPTSRIDYWFDANNGTASVGSVAVIADSTDSDHRPVVATYNVTPSTTTTTTTTTTSSTTTTLLSDSFASLDTTKWSRTLFTGSQDTSIGVNVAGNVAVGPLKSSMTGSHYNGISSGSYNLGSNGYAYAQLTQAPNTGTYAYAMFALGVNGSNFYRWYESADGLVAEKKINGTKTTLVDVPYDATADVFLRIAIQYDSSTGTEEVVFSTAPNNSGVPGTWTARYTEPWNSSYVSSSQLRVELKAGTSDAIVSPGSGIWDTVVIAKQ